MSKTKKGGKAATGDAIMACEVVRVCPDCGGPAACECEPHEGDCLFTSEMLVEAKNCIEHLPTQTGNEAILYAPPIDVRNVLVNGGFQKVGMRNGDPVFRNATGLTAIRTQPYALVFYALNQADRMTVRGYWDLLADGEFVGAFVSPLDLDLGNFVFSQSYVAQNERGDWWGGLTDDASSKIRLTIGTEDVYHEIAEGRCTPAEVAAYDCDEMVDYQVVIDVGEIAYRIARGGEDFDIEKAFTKWEGWESIGVPFSDYDDDSAPAIKKENDNG